MTARVRWEGDTGKRFNLPYNVIRIGVNPGGVALMFPAWQADLVGLLATLVEWKSFRQIITGWFKQGASPKEA